MCYDVSKAVSIDSSRLYAKASQAEVDRVINLIQNDSQRMQLLSILSSQVISLAVDGQPSLSTFLASIEEHSLRSSDDISSLQAQYDLKR